MHSSGVGCFNTWLTVVKRKGAISMTGNNIFYIIGVIVVIVVVLKVLGLW